MAKKIIWTEQAVNDRKKFSNTGTNETATSDTAINSPCNSEKQSDTFARFNYFGTSTDIEDVRVAVCGHYLIFYRLGVDAVEIVTVFDSRRNPDDLKIL